MTPDVTITHNTNLSEYFRENLDRHSRKLDPAPNEETLWYLGQMLSHFAYSKHFFSYENGELTLRPLAMLYKDASEASSDYERSLFLRKLGDMALFLGALFPESYHRRGISKDYFIGMGGNAYAWLSGNTRANAHIYDELSRMFTRILDLVARACHKEAFFNANDIIQLYESWLKSKDPFLEEQLQAIGISTNHTIHMH